MDNEKAQLTQAEIRTLQPVELCRRCMEPVIPKFRAQSLQARLRAVETLTVGQQMLFAFWCLYNYGSDGWMGLCRRLTHVTSSEHFWSSLTTSADYFEVPELRRVIAEFQPLRDSDTEQHRGRIAELDAELERLCPQALHQVGDHIRRQPADFVDVVD